MCIAILNNKGLISKKEFFNSWENNPDGGGFAYYNGKKVVIIKEMNNKKYLFKQYTEHRKKHINSPFLIHFRIATHGLINETNCHPFKVSDYSAFIHNGVIFNTSKEGDFSDTYLFNELIMKKLPDNWETSECMHELIAAYIGQSKIVYLNKFKAYIINEHLGNWESGNWYSNKSYQCSYNTYTPKNSYQKYWDYEYNLEKYAEVCDGCHEAKGIEYYPETACNLCKECAKYFHIDALNH